MIRALGRQEQVFGKLLRYRRAALDDIVGADVFDKRTKCAQEVDPEMFEEAAILGGQCRFDHMLGNFFQRHGIVEVDATLADDVTVLVLERYRELIECQPVLLVDFLEGRQCQGIHQNGAAGADRQCLGAEFIGNAPPAGQAEARKKAGRRVVAVLDQVPGRRQRRVDPRVEAEPVDQAVPPALSEKPIAQLLPSI